MGTLLNTPLSVRARLAGTLAFFLLLLAVNGLFVRSSTNRVQATFREVSQDNIAATEAVGAFRAQLSAEFRSAEAYVHAGDNAEPEGFAIAAKEAGAALERYGNVIARAPPQARAMIDEMTESFESMRHHDAKLGTATDALFRLPPATTPPRQLRVAWKKVLRAYDRALPIVESALERERGELLENVQSVDIALADLRFKGLATTTAGIFLAVLLGALLYRSIRQPLDNLANTARAIMGGERSRRARITRRDEIGEVALAFNAMADELILGEGVRRERNYLKAVMRAMPDIVVVLGSDGTVRAASAAVLQLLGREPDELVGHSARALFVDAPGAAPNLSCLHEGCVAENVILRSATGDTIAASLSSAAISETDEILWVLRDMRLTHELIANLEMARDQAVQAALYKAEFLANMSHEIRTPLNGIFGMTELAMDTPDDGERRDYLGRVRACAESLLAIINQVLDFSRLNAGHVELENVDFSVSDVVNLVLDIFSIDADKKGVKLIGDLDSTLPDRVRGDPGRLQQVLLNLTANAVKFTHHGEVIVRADRRDDADGTVSVRWAVQDTGIGIPADKQAVIFEAFQQADGSTTRQYGGTGLGLAISKRLVRAMGGTLAVVSEPGRGSTFSFTIVMPIGAVSGAETENAADRPLQPLVPDPCRHPERQKAGHEGRRDAGAPVPRS